MDTDTNSMSSIPKLFQVTLQVLIYEGWKAPVVEIVLKKRHFVWFYKWLCATVFIVGWMVVKVLCLFLLGEYSDVC